MEPNIEYMLIRIKQHMGEWLFNNMEFRHQVGRWATGKKVRAVDR